MRVTADHKAATRLRILDSAKRLFRSKGFDQATTRDIARDVGIASGTMFNYFPTKEGIVVELADGLLAKAYRDFARNRRSSASLEEDLFAHIATQLRHLRPLRKFIRPLLDTVLSPASGDESDVASNLRTVMAEHAAGLLSDHGFADPSSVALNVYWSLYVGTLTFWCNDDSPKLEDTLAMLDGSSRMYAKWLNDSKLSKGAK